MGLKKIGFQDENWTEFGLGGYQAALLETGIYFGSRFFEQKKNQVERTAQ
jgi:hypothetical protein